MPVSLSFAGARTIEGYRLRRSQNNVGRSRQLFPKENRREMNRFSGGFNNQVHGNSWEKFVLTTTRSGCGDNDVSAVIDGFGSVRGGNHLRIRYLEPTP
jgi:hypothetical protein